MKKRPWLFATANGGFGMRRGMVPQPQFKNFGISGDCRGLGHGPRNRSLRLRRIAAGSHFLSSGFEAWEIARLLEWA